MKKVQLKWIALVCGLLFLSNLKAQYVTIPDTAFVSFLQTTACGPCLNGNQLDTACPQVTGMVVMNFSNTGFDVKDFTGIQYFKGLDTLVGPGLDNFFLSGSLNYIPSLPPHIEYLSLASNVSLSIPPLPDSLRQLYLGGMGISAIPVLPATLTNLSVEFTAVSALPALPNNIISLICQLDTFLSALPVLPNSLLYLDCLGTALTSLPIVWPASLNTLDFSSSAPVAVPPLPASLVNLAILGAQISSFPSSFPAALTYLDIDNVILPVGFPSAPGSLTTLQYNNMHESSYINNLPANLQSFGCSGDSISVLPALPATLEYLGCGMNLLQSLPTLPPNLQTLDCSNNPLLYCLPLFPASLVNVYFGGTAVSCVPIYNSAITADPILTSLPLCTASNSNGCSADWNISGQTFLDGNSNCVADINEAGFKNLKAGLSLNGVLLSQTYTGGNGGYSFKTDSLGTYKVSLDTAGLPLLLLCPTSNVITDTLTANNPMQARNDFSLACPQGFDLGIRSIDNSYPFMPLQLTTVSINACDMARFYGAQCAPGVGGTVTASFLGPVSYISAAQGAIPPSSTGVNTLTWNISDFDQIGDTNNFNIQFRTDYSAQITDQVCVTVTVTPAITGDNNNGNDVLTQCFPVLAAWDPNYKEVSPAGEIDPTQRWLTYAIHFQNTGTAPAINIHVDDTIDISKFNISTFQLISYSTKPNVQVANTGVIRFDFAGIYLADSGSNFAGSQGFVKFKIKLKDEVGVNTQLSNQASIYFDLNAPVVTNAATNTVVAHVANAIANEAENAAIYIFPNPANSNLVVTTPATDNTAIREIKITDVLGKQVIYQPVTNPHYTQLDVASLSTGVYFVAVVSDKGTTTQKVVISR